MDQKVVCMFLLLVVGTSHALQCYESDFDPNFATEDNFDPANATKVTCDADHEDICIKSMYILSKTTTMYWKSTILIAAIGIGPGGGIYRQCDDLKAYKNYLDPIPELDKCIETTGTDGPIRGQKGTVCTCSQDFCNA